MDASKILPIVLVALILVSAVQAVQLNSLKEKLAEGKLSVSSAKTAAPTGGVAISGGTPAGIESLPQMVGGC